MDFLGAVLANVASMVFLILVAAGVMKAFQIGSTLNEMKDLLADIKRNTTIRATDGPLSSAQMSIESADNLLRAVSEMDHPVPPVPIELSHKS